MIRYGDFVRLDYKGPLYRLASTIAVLDPKAGEVITTDPPTGWQLLDSLGNQFTNVPAGYTTTGVPFQIIRQPVRSSATPLQLPEGTVIDLAQSGTTTFPFPATLNPVILFSPNGSVERVTRDATGTMTRPSGPIFLLTGRRDLMTDIVGFDKNLSDPTPEQLHLSNFWITVAHQTGQVSVSENAQNTGSVNVARTFAQSGQSAGGR
jgi:hypothetical protein